MKKPRLLTLVIAFGVIAAGCRVRPQDVAGPYVRRVPGISERLELNLDGTFKQTVTIGTNAPLSLSGTWTNEYKRVTFDQLYITYDIMNGRAMNPPKILGFVNLGWEEGLLIKSAEGDYIFHGPRY